ncbi:rhombosortase [Aquabacterium sp. OR-4]|uniref:rhombosortase n=1 Tax=Aquabacterium sp. OR-4 TaxID=2978127 RepID=UPI0021B18B08|nr:rhombosortase [Aquabacterium sp. OR-4]MDT7834052.1 rhombosortase [Aquabacterium sp. OR-4]
MTERPASPRAWLGLSGLAALAALLLAAAAPGWQAALDWAPELALREPWRAITAACVHLSRLHLLANLAGCALVAALGVAAGCGPRATAAWALAWPLTQLALLAQPALTRYAGLSGVLHAAVAVVVVQLLVAGRGRHRAIGAALGAGLLAKLLLEAPWQGPLRLVPGWDIAIAPLAHSAGAVAGGVCAAALGVGRRRQSVR